MLKGPFPAVVVFLAVFCLFPDVARADTLYLIDGRKLKGLVIEEYQDRILFKTYVEEREYRRNEIDDVFYDEAEHNFLYLGRRALASGDLVRGWGFFEKSLRLNPQLSLAREGLARANDLSLKEGHEAVSRLTLQENLGARIERDRDRIVVTMVRPGGAFDVSGMEIGDRLVRVFDAPCRYRDAQSVIRELVGPAGSEVIVTVERDLVYRTGDDPWWRRMLSRFRQDMEVHMQYGGLTVKDVQAGLGLLAGDRITKISGKSTRYMPLAGAREALRTPGEVHLTFERVLQAVRQ